MKYRFLVLDLDGTLLQDDNTILPGCRAAIARLLERGVVVTLSTGRAFPSAKKVADQLGLTCALICYNGAVLQAADTVAPALAFPLPVELMRETALLCEARGWHLQLYHNGEIVVAELDEYTLRDPDYQNMPCREVGPLSRAALSPSPKMMTRSSPEERALRYDVLSEAFAGRMHITGSTADLVEMMLPSVSKSHTLGLLCDMLGISPAETVACGDGQNDRDMLSFAGVGCAMANAHELTKQAADYLCHGANGEGVLEAIRRFFPEAGV